MSRYQSTSVSHGAGPVRERREHRKMQPHHQRIRALIREELSRKLLSYAATALAAPILGLVIIPAASSLFTSLPGSARSGGFFVDFYFLAVVALLSVNWLSHSYMYIHRDPFSGWLAFLRSLPVSPREVVLARSLVMLTATLIMTALFFTPVFVVSRVWLAGEFAVVQFLWFALLWLGYALFAGGINLYLELGLRGKAVLALQFVWLVVLVAVAGLAGGNLVLTTFELSGSYGPLPAVLALLAGGVLFAILAKATEHRLVRREFAA